jgi:bacterioferritin (cytochrome b1)
MNDGEMLIILTNMLQDDLKNERKHMLFYLQASVMVQGLHREELGELLLKESLDEHNHVTEFSRLIVQLGGIPNQDVNPFPINLTCPFEIFKYAQEMEQEVSTVYGKRLIHTDELAQHGNAQAYYVHLFYEDQLQDSQRTALEFNQFIRPYLQKNAHGCLPEQAMHTP